MKELMKFKSDTFGSLQAFTHDGECFFYASDVAKALGYSKASEAVKRHVDPEDITSTKSFSHETGEKSLGRPRNVINESGVYALIFGSKLPEAKAFKRWVTSEVLPSLRKYDVYTSGLELMTEAQREVIEHAVSQLKKAMDMYDSETDKRGMVSFKGKVAWANVCNAAIERAVNRSGLSEGTVSRLAYGGLEATKRGLLGK